MNAIVNRFLLTDHKENSVQIFVLMEATVSYFLIVQKYINSKQKILQQTKYSLYLENISTNMRKETGLNGFSAIITLLTLLILLIFIDN